MLFIYPPLSFPNSNSRLSTLNHVSSYTRICTLSKTFVQFPKLSSNNNERNNNNNFLPPPFPNPFNPSSRPYFSSSFFLPPAKITSSEELSIKINHLKTKENLEPVHEIIQVIQEENSTDDDDEKEEEKKCLRLFAQVIQIIESRKRVWLRPLVIVEGDWEYVRDVRGKDLLLGQDLVRKVGDEEKIKIRLGIIREREDNLGEDRNDNNDDYVDDADDGDPLMRFMEKLKGM